MPELTGDLAACEQCPLNADRTVASRGPVPARVLLLSGAPRYHEEREGLAFASPAFSWLQDTLAETGIDPSSVHYATLIGCRPPHQRPVGDAEIAACAPRLERAITAVAPEVIVLCGPEAVAAMLPGVALGAGHGTVVRRGRRRYYPIRHPYAALHSPRYVEEVLGDLGHLAALLAQAWPAEEPVPDSAPLAEPTTALGAPRGVETAHYRTLSTMEDHPPVDPVDSTGDGEGMAVAVVPQPTAPEPAALALATPRPSEAGLGAGSADGSAGGDEDEHGPTQLSLF